MTKQKAIQETVPHNDVKEPTSALKNLRRIPNGEEVWCMSGLKMPREVMRRCGVESSKVIRKMALAF
jgi:hypothetical protein